MKVLLAHDGSEGSDAAILDLARAGLPARTEIVVLTVADVVMITDAQPASADRIGEVATRARERAERALEAARANAAAVVERVRERVPDSIVLGEALADSPAWGVVRASESMGVDLIVVGSHGRGGLARLALGSVSQKVAAEANGSVRIARAPSARDRAQVRLVIGFDGSDDAHGAVEAIAARTWPPGSAAFLITAADDSIATTFASPSHPLAQWTRPGDTSEESSMQRMLEAAAEPLRAAGLEVETEVRAGDPRRVLIDEASRREADAIVVGARGLSAVERFLLGSVSQAIAARAACSVEIARRARSRGATAA